MTTLTREYLQNNFTSIRSLKQTDEAALKIVSGPDGSFYMLKETRRTGLPYVRLQSLSHPALPKIYYVEETGGTTLILEEYINGRNLADLAATGSLPQDQVQDIALQLCSVLSLLHRHRILHRDIKPSNIIWQADGRVKLIDFDAARSEKESAASDTQLLGTKGFAPPEQFGFAQTDARSDLYALGKTMAVLLGTSYQGRLTPIIRKATQLDGERRYQSAAELARALRFSAKRYALQHYALPALLVLLLLPLGWWGWHRYALPAATNPASVETPAATETPETTPGTAAKPAPGTTPAPGTALPEGPKTSGKVETVPGQKTNINAENQAPSPADQSNSQEKASQAPSQPAAPAYLPVDSSDFSGSYDVAELGLSQPLRDADYAHALHLSISPSLTSSDSLGLAGRSKYVGYSSQNLSLTFTVTNHSAYTIEQPELLLYPDRLTFGATSGQVSRGKIYAGLGASLAPGASASASVSVSQPVLLHPQGALLVTLVADNIEGPRQLGRLILNNDG